MPDDPEEQALASALRGMAGPISHIDGADADLLMQAADIIDAVALYRAAVAKLERGFALVNVGQKNAAEAEMYELLDAANADAAEVANAPRS